MILQYLLQEVADHLSKLDTIILVMAYLDCLVAQTEKELVQSLSYIHFEGICGLKHLKVVSYHIDNRLKFLNTVEREALNHEGPVSH